MGTRPLVEDFSFAPAVVMKFCQAERH